MSPARQHLAGSRAARARLDAWFEAQGWKPLKFQREMWRRYLAGESGLLHTPTGSGKTLAAFGGPLLEVLAEQSRAPSALAIQPDVVTRSRAARIPKRATNGRLTVMWITPLRALAADTLRALREPIDALGLDWQVGLRTGDASARDKRLARAGKLDVLVTTPESLALHHGSLDPKLRSAAEQGLRDGSLRCVVATSSLDLGVDLPAVDQVLQIGSPKGAARLLQRAGRARHRPGEAGAVVCVPTHALELIEYAAARRAIAGGRIESRRPPVLSLDVLAQHCVTLALGGGFASAPLLEEVQGTHAFAELDDASWNAVLDFIVQGGRALEHYPDYRRVIRAEDGTYRVEERRVAFRHRLSIGTITSDGAVAVKFLKGGGLGSVEEGFIARLRPGDRFQFAGRSLLLVRLENMTAYVRLAKTNDGKVPKWAGGRMPLSSELAREVETVLSTSRGTLSRNPTGTARGARSDTPELRAIAPLLDLQSRLSALPEAGRLLVESIGARDGQHLFVYPFAGRLVHEGLAALIASRWGRQRPNTFSMAANDYGLALSPAHGDAPDITQLRNFLSPEGLMGDLRESLNLGELARRQFREIARIAGLLPPSLPGRAARSMRQLQASSGLIFDVLQRYDPRHLLLQLAEREVFSSQLEISGLRATLIDCAGREIALHSPRGLTPLSFPLWAESMRGQLSTEDWKVRVARAAAKLEQRHAG